MVGPLPQVQAAVASAALGNSGGSLQGRVILITGAGGGLGRAAAVLFAQRGAKVVAADVDAAAATETAAQVGGEAHGVAVDVANEESVQAMVASAVAKFGRIDGALNAAGIEGGRARLHETSSANYDRVLGVNLRGTFLCMKAEIDQMLKQPPPVPRGAVIAAASDASAPAALSAASAPAAIDTRNYSIVNVSSTAGQAAMPEFSCYSASKFALIGFTRSAAKEYAKDGIRVHAVCPSTTATPMVERFQSAWPEWQARQNASFPVGRIGRAEEVAAACAFLLSWDCPMVTGTTLTIDGGAGA